MSPVKQHLVLLDFLAIENPFKQALNHLRPARTSDAVSLWGHSKQTFSDAIAAEGFNDAPLHCIQYLPIFAVPAVGRILCSGITFCPGCYSLLLKLDLRFWYAYIETQALELGDVQFFSMIAGIEMRN